MWITLFVLELLRVLASISGALSLHPVVAGILYIICVPHTLAMQGVVIDMQQLCSQPILTQNSLHYKT